MQMWFAIETGGLKAIHFQIHELDCTINFAENFNVRNISMALFQVVLDLGIELVHLE